MTDYAIYMQNWITITTNNIFIFSFVLIFMLLVLFLITKLDAIIGTNRPKKRVEKGYGGSFITFGYIFYAFYVLLVLFMAGAIILAPVIGLIKTLFTEQNFPISYFLIVGLTITYFLYHYLLEETHRRFNNKNNWYFLSDNNILILKFNRIFAYIPLKFLETIQVDKQNRLIKFIFKIKIFMFLKIKPKWVFEFSNEEEFNDLLYSDLAEYDHIKELISLKRKKFVKLFPTIPMANKTTLAKKQFELPKPLGKLFP